jgi:hypothetical protein
LVPIQSHFGKIGLLYEQAAIWWRGFGGSLWGCGILGPDLTSDCDRCKDNPRDACHVPSRRLVHAPSPNDAVGELLERIFFGLSPNEKLEPDAVVRGIVAVTTLGDRLTKILRRRARRSRSHRVNQYVIAMLMAATAD